MTIGRVLAGALWLALATLTSCSGDKFETGGAGGSATDGGAGTGGTAGADIDAGGCPAGQKRCAGQCVDRTDPTYGCGAQACDPCNLQHATADCDNGACRVAQCDPGFADCKPGVQGCETSTNSATNCGTCGNDCKGQVCDNGKCTSGCAPGKKNCGGACADVSADPQNCGDCGVVCAAQPNSTALCQAGSCKLQCNPNFDDCDATPGNGCEVNLSSDPKHCGGCNAPCPTPPIGATGQNCGKGNCVCPAGRFACNADPGVACVYNDKDPKFCGSTCKLCPDGDGCSSGSCFTPVCAYGLTKCSGQCVSLDSDWDNCGACGNTCDFTETCVKGNCIMKAAGLECPSSHKSCFDDCALTGLDAANCGSCGTQCIPGRACMAGVCAPLPLANEPWECPPGTKTCIVPQGWPEKPAPYYCWSSCVYGGAPVSSN